MMTPCSLLTITQSIGRPAMLARRGDTSRCEIEEGFQCGSTATDQTGIEFEDPIDTSFIQPVTSGEKPTYIQSKFLPSYQILSVALNTM